ncbi:MAG: acyl-CoA thioesterase [Halovenus sp.]
MDADSTVPLSQSHTEMTEILVPGDTNSLGRALGGTVLHWMDICGTVAAMRFANRPCVTASMDHIEFMAAIDLGEVAVIQGYVFDTGRTSLDIKVDVQVEDPLDGETRDVTSSFLTYVAVDEDGTPTRVPDVACEDETEEQLRSAALRERREQIEALADRFE